MAKLVIKGHATRGKEVIEILEMLGGENKEGHCGNNPTAAYYISHKNNTIVCDFVHNIYKCVDYTLEKFLKKFPYKVGDKVWLHYENSTIRVEETITCMRWCDKWNYVLYDVSTCCKLRESAFTPYKKETMDKTKFPYEIGTRVSVKSQYIKKLATIVGLSYNSCACMQYEIKFDGEDVVIHYPTDLMIPITAEEKGTKVENREIMNAKEFLSNKLNDVVKQENRLHSITHGDTLLLLKSNMESYYKILYKKEVLSNILNNTDDEDMEDVKNHLQAMIKAFREDLDNRPFMGQTNSLSINITMLWENETKRELINLFELTLTLV